MSLYILMMGVQGSGKGTQTPFLSQRYHIPAISTGDLFRALKGQDTPLAHEVQAIMQRGGLVPDSITDQMVRERLSQPDAQQGAIFDGYPRTVGQAEALDSFLAQRQAQLNLVIVLELERDIAFKRAVGRRFSQDKKRVYNIYYNPPKAEGIDDVDGQPLSQRADDYPDAVNKRLEDYYNTTLPLVAYYQQKGLVHEIKADQSIEAVRSAIFAAVDQALAN
jgi:adenylate kinase